MKDSERLKTYSVRLKFHDDHMYPQHITVPTREEAIELWVQEFLDIREVKGLNE